MLTQFNPQKWNVYSNKKFLLITMSKMRVKV